CDRVDRYACDVDRRRRCTERAYRRLSYARGVVPERARTRPIANASTPATANEIRDALVHVGGVKCRLCWRAIHQRDHHPTKPGLMSWYATNPAAHGTSISQRGRAASDTSQRPRWNT